MDKNLIAQIQQLPPKLRTFIAEGSWITAIKGIAKNFSLDEDQENALQTETLIVLSAVEDISSLKNSIQSNVQVAPNDAERIAAAVIAQAIAPIRAELDLIQSGEEALPQQAPAPEISRTTNQPIAMLDDKLSDVIKLPSEETHYKEPGTDLAKKDPSIPMKPPQSAPYTQGSDPYREPPV